MSSECTTSVHESFRTYRVKCGKFIISGPISVRFCDFLSSKKALGTFATSTSSLAMLEEGTSGHMIPKSTETVISSRSLTQFRGSGIGGVVAACSAYNRKIVGSIPGSALLISEVNVVDIQLRALLGLCSDLVHSAKCAGNRM